MSSKYFGSARLLTYYNDFACARVTVIRDNSKSILGVG